MPFRSISNCDESDIMNNRYPLVPFYCNILRIFVQIVYGAHLFSAHICSIGMYDAIGGILFFRQQMAFYLLYHVPMEGYFMYLIQSHQF